MYKISTKYVNIKNIESDIKEIINECLPYYNLDSNLTIEKVNGGTSNIIYLCKSTEFNSQPHKKLLFRIYGDIPLDREKETKYMSVLSEHNLAAKVVAQFQNGVVYFYIDGITLDLESLFKENVNILVIKEMTKLHSIDLNVFGDAVSERKPFIYDMIEKFIDLLPDKLSDVDDNIKYQKEYFSKYTWLDYVGKIKTQLTLLNLPISFTHNDLLHRNIIITHAKDRIHFIDYEYCGYNYSVFDIGNYFNEFAGLENPNYDLFPTENFQKWWIKHYLIEMSKLKPADPRFQDVNDEMIDRWYKSVNLAALLSMILWSVWNVYQSIISDIDCDFMKLAYTRLDEFVKRARVLL